ncbi:hypothetical protein [uncultured Ruthenibacterium sp.]|uniref:hypothetical protein n=1 Tax=uncultured Ruthenibacterium sp. TaxID=1905347 RepID=UPI00349E6762
MWFWEKEELYMGPSGEKAAALCAALEEAGIVCESLYRNVLGGGRSRFGTIGALDSAGIHYVYVKRKDLEAAEAIAHRVLHP